MRTKSLSRPALRFPGESLRLARSAPTDEQDRTRRAFAATALIVLSLAGLLFLRLWFLQMVEGEELHQRSEHNRLRLQDLPPWRGMILDRDGQVLVANRPSYDLVVIMEDIADIPLLAQRLAKLLHLDGGTVKAQLEAARSGGVGQVRVRGDLTWDEMAMVQTFEPELPGAIIQVQPKREYLQKGLACHVLGYLGEITEGQLKGGRFPDYKMGEYLGKCGIEAAWEESLRGRRGYRRFEVDAHGRELSQLDRYFPTAGANITLTLDTRMQREAEDCLAGHVGAIVALEPKSGKILAMASSPAYSQEVFERGLSSQEWKKLSGNKDHPLENRAFKGMYPPGSTFKIVMAVAALEEGIIGGGTTFKCTGELESGGHTFHCWKSRGHGIVNLHRALVESCDVFFYQVGKRLGIERLAAWCRRFGLAVPTGLRLDRELPGLAGTPAWKLARFHQPWKEGDTLSMSIGQGYVLTTPLQMARAAAAIANGGLVLEPQLVQKVESPTGEVLFESKPVVKSRLEASPMTLTLVRRALKGVVAEGGGTGKRARLSQVQVAGKTGTAQVVTLEKEKQEKDKRGKTSYRFQNHAWFVAFAPVDDPQIAVAVLVEHGGGGGEVAAPIARQFLAAYFPEEQEQVVEVDEPEEVIEDAD